MTPISRQDIETITERTYERCRPQGSHLPAWSKVEASYRQARTDEIETAFQIAAEMGYDVIKREA